MLLAGYVRNLATTEADIEAAVRTSGLDPSAWMSSYADLLRRLTDPQRFPALTEFIASGVFDAADGPDDEFIFGLDRILDGVEVAHRRRTAGVPIVTAALLAVLSAVPCRRRRATALAGESAAGHGSGPIDSCHG